MSLTRDLEHPHAGLQLLLSTCTSQALSEIPSFLSNHGLFMSPSQTFLFKGQSIPTPAQVYGKVAALVSGETQKLPFPSLWR